MVTEVALEKYRKAINENIVRVNKVVAEECVGNIQIRIKLNKTVSF